MKKKGGVGSVWLRCSVCLKNGGLKDHDEVDSDMSEVLIDIEVRVRRSWLPGEPSRFGLEILMIIK